jgi:aminoglycoside phosphotransferase (APT) family kinase protein
VPHPLLLDPTGQLLSGPFLVMSFIEGSADVTAEDVDSCLDIMADTLLRLHRFPTAELPPLPARLDPVPELHDYLPDAPESRDLLEQISAWSASALTGTFTGAPALLHGDFWPGNLLWEEGRLTAILDWEDAALGDPASDVACCRLELRYKYGVTATERFTQRYQASNPLPADRLALWDLYVGSAAMRFMGAWGLEPDREAAMRAEANASVTSAAVKLKQLLTSY